MTMTREEMDARGSQIFAALDGLDGPRAFEFVLGALATILNRAPGDQKPLLVAKAVGTLQAACRTFDA